MEINFDINTFLKEKGYTALSDKFLRDVFAFSKVQENILPKDISMLTFPIDKMVSDQGLQIVQRNQVQFLINQHRMLSLMARIPSANWSACSTIVPKLTSQFCQDLFALAGTGFKSEGYFVDFGATNGKNLSNSYVMEKEFNWTGILAEPAKIWHEDLRKNRTSNISTKCVWVKSGEQIEFNEVATAELSTIKDLSSNDQYAQQRQNGKSYSVETITLLHLLEAYDAPSYIDYLSIDTEGSELDILNAFDFEKYSFGVITCEHNYTENRDKIHALLTGNGYHRIFEDLSNVDDWYVAKPLLENFVMMTN